MSLTDGIRLGLESRRFGDRLFIEWKLGRMVWWLRIKKPCGHPPWIYSPPDFELKSLLNSESHGPHWRIDLKHCPRKSQPWKFWRHWDALDLKPRISTGPMSFRRWMEIFNCLTGMQKKTRPIGSPSQPRETSILWDSNNRMAWRSGITKAGPIVNWCRK